MFKNVSRKMLGLTGMSRTEKRLLILSSFDGVSVSFSPDIPRLLPRAISIREKLRPLLADLASHRALTDPSIGDATNS